MAAHEKLFADFGSKIVFVATKTILPQNGKDATYS